jgi:nicotinamide-nucleotide amidase
MHLQLVERFQKICLDRKLTFSCAESCTGGMLSSLLTACPGASEYYIGGLVTYSNFAKSKFLNINEELLTIYGAVSPQVAKAMAENCRQIFGTALSASITGVAGPAADRLVKENGLIYLGIGGRNITLVKKIKLIGSRNEIRQQSCVKILESLIDFLSLV